MTKLKNIPFYFNNKIDDALFVNIIKFHTHIFFKGLVTDECGSTSCLNGGIYEDEETSYTCTCPTEYIGPRCQFRSPAGWTGPLPHFYQSFDSQDGLTLMTRHGQSNADVLVPGKVSRTTCQNHIPKILSFTNG